MTGAQPIAPAAGGGPAPYSTVGRAGPGGRPARRRWPPPPRCTPRDSARCPPRGTAPRHVRTVAARAGPPAPGGHDIIGDPRRRPPSGDHRPRRTGHCWSPSGQDQSDPFLIRTEGRYFLYTSGIAGSAPGQRPGGLGHRLRRLEPGHRCPARPAPLGRPRATPGPRTSTGSGRPTSSTSPPWWRDETVDGVHRDGHRSRALRPVHCGRHAVHLPGRPGRFDRPPGLHRRRRHQLDAVEVRPEHRRRHHPDQDVVAAPVPATAWAWSASPRSSWGPTSRGRAPSSRPRTWSRSTAPTGSSTRATGSTSRRTPSGRPAAPARRAVRGHVPAGRCSPPTSRARGRARPPSSPDASGVWMLYSPGRSQAPHPDVPPAPVFIDPDRLQPPRSAYLAAGGPPPTPRRAHRPDPADGPVACQPRSRRSSAATALPSAWPLVAFITSPVKNPASLSSPVAVARPLVGMGGHRLGHGGDQ